MAAANDLRKGMAIKYNGNAAIVLEVHHRTPGNLRAFVQAIIRYISTGKSADVRFSSTDKVELVDIERKQLDFSYKDGEDYVFSDPETYETVTLSPEIVGDAKNYLVENGPVTVTFVDDKAVTIELPSSVVLTVTDAPEGVRGDSANNVQKAIKRPIMTCVWPKYRIGELVIRPRTVRVTTGMRIMTPYRVKKRALPMYFSISTADT